MIRDVITFHTDARTALINNQVNNTHILKTYLLSNLPLVIAASFGLLSALLRRDWRCIPLVAWMLVTTYMLLLVVPLFYRHFIALDPPLIAMAVMGLGRAFPAGSFLSRFKLPQIMPALAAITALGLSGIAIHEKAMEHRMMQAADFMFQKE